MMQIYQPDDRIDEPELRPEVVGLGDRRWACQRVKEVIEAGTRLEAQRKFAKLILGKIEEIERNKHIDAKIEKVILMLLLWAPERYRDREDPQKYTVTLADKGFPFGGMWAFPYIEVMQFRAEVGYRLKNPRDFVVEWDDHYGRFAHTDVLRNGALIHGDLKRLGLDDEDWLEEAA